MGAPAANTIWTNPPPSAQAVNPLAGTTAAAPKQPRRENQRVRSIVPPLFGKPAYSSIGLIGLQIRERPSERSRTGAAWGRPPRTRIRFGNRAHDRAADPQVVFWPIPGRC